MFKKGDKVVCVKPIDDLVKDEIYTINEFDSIGVSVVETQPYLANMFYGFRFRKLDYSFADELLANIKKQVKEESLELV
ncbi:hypothetical protein [Tenacibaculum finnmarkense]|uniref:hypothetical protein n=1 Tax=Tenacibaculum finnmarkense TaxID=2781243 RepID=UPI002079B429|nr:hypothetical protein [Tenacibaculum finnmarkense]MCM8906799.1 hypothetical protein [Tenacibaculum finnmarkense genomovar finnmarkense]